MVRYIDSYPEFDARIFLEHVGIGKTLGKFWNAPKTPIWNIPITGESIMVVNEQGGQFELGK